MTPACASDSPRGRRRNPGHRMIPNGLWLLAVAMVVVGMAASVFSLARQKYLTEAVPVAFRARALSTLGGVSRPRRDGSIPLPVRR
ncbi:hypothetical protein J2S97_004183 [Arthrobacter oryzae]|nr:hypothetical protein [Arthrobacter oryzae]